MWSCSLPKKSESWITSPKVLAIGALTGTAVAVIALLTQMFTRDRPAEAVAAAIPKWLDTRVSAMIFLPQEDVPGTEYSEVLWFTLQNPSNSTITVLDIVVRNERGEFRMDKSSFTLPARAEQKIKIETLLHSHTVTCAVGRLGDGMFVKEERQLELEISEDEIAHGPAFGMLNFSVTERGVKQDSSTQPMKC